MRRILALLGLLVVPFAFAATPVTVTTGAPQTYTTTSTPGSVDVNAGYVIETNVTVETVTQWWTGTYGNVNETVVLGAGTSKFFVWNLSTLTGYVYFTTASSVNFADLNINVSTTDVNAAIASITSTSWTPSADENFEATFANTDTTGTYCSIANAKYVLTLDNTPAAVWPTCAYKENATGALVFEAKIRQDQAAFDGSTVDYQALLPAVVESGAGGLVYYVWKG